MRQVSKAVCVGIVWGWSWKRESQSPVEAVLDNVRIRRSQKGKELSRGEHGLRRRMLGQL